MLGGLDIGRILVGVVAGLGVEKGSQGERSQLIVEIPVDTIKIVIEVVMIQLSVFKVEPIASKLGRDDPQMLRSRHRFRNTLGD